MHVGLIGSSFGKVNAADLAHHLQALYEEFVQTVSGIRTDRGFAGFQDPRFEVAAQAVQNAIAQTPSPQLASAQALAAQASKPLTRLQ